MAVPGATSQTDIVNKAQVLLGQAKRFTDIEATEDPAAIDYRTLWPIALRSALALHPWNNAVSRTVLHPHETPPAFGWAYRYKLPASCLRYLPWSRDDDYYFEGEVEEGYILTDQPVEIRIRFIKLVTDLSILPPLFVEVLAHQLALDRCEAGTSKRGLSNDIAARLEQLLADARRADGLETGARARMRPIRASGWASARYHPNGWR